MCGRYALVGEPDQIQKRFGVKKTPIDFKPETNVTPGSMMPVILSENPDAAVLAKWGLIPFWASDPKIGYKMINARAETIAEKPAFRKSFLTQRCLIPATGFYEWLKTDTDRIPYFFHIKDQDIFAFAGLYDRWKDVEGRELLTFTIITTSPNSLVEKIHNRMPAILAENSEKFWLDKNLSERSKLEQLLTPYASDKMVINQVPKIVNYSSYDNKEQLKIM